MKKHGMDVMSLEEFEPNREFVGRYIHRHTTLHSIACYWYKVNVFTWVRNWNAGENVELVLKSLNGQWLPFNMVRISGTRRHRILTVGSKVWLLLQFVLT
jgi:DNA-dependent metalloprotease WSS1